MQSLTFKNKERAILMKLFSKKMINKKNIAYQRTQTGTATSLQQAQVISGRPSLL